MKNIMILFLTFSTLAGCTNRMFYKHPEYNGVVKIEVSEQTVSTFTETPAEDYLIPNSQVFVGGRGFFQKNIGLMPFVGALTAVEIDRSLNEEEARKIESKLQVKFNTELSDILKRSSLQQTVRLKYDVIQNYDMPDINLLPSARFEIQPESKAALSFRVTARCKDNISGKEGEKNYYYTFAEPHPLAGWADNEAVLFKQAATKALTRISQAIIQDISGFFNAKILPNQRHLVARATPFRANSILLAEYQDYLIYMPMADNEPLTSIFFIVER